MDWVIGTFGGQDWFTAHQIGVQAHPIQPWQSCTFPATPRAIVPCH